MKEKMHLIQSLNYIGQKYELSRFLAAANNTDDLNQHMRYSVYSITELYVIRTDDLKLVKNEKKHNELHILQVDVIRPDITPGNIKKIVNAIQRKVLYNVALIFNYEDEWFQIAVPHIHSGRSSQISVVDRCRVSNWIDYGSLSSLFCDFETRLNNTWDSFENCVSFLRGLVIHYSAYGIEQFVLVEKSNELEEWICAKWNEYQSDGIFLNDRDLIELSQDEFDEFEVDGIQAVYEQWNVVLSVYGWEIIDDFVEGIIESCYRDGNTKRAEEISTFYSEYKQKAQNTHWGLEDDKSDYYLDNDNPNDRFDDK